jgi:elongation factor P
MNELRRGHFVDLEKVPYMILENEFVKPGKGTPFNRIRMKNLFSNKTDEKTFKASDRLEKANIESQEMQYLYNDGAVYHFMNPESYEQIELTEEKISDAKKYLQEQIICTVMFYNEKVLTITLPNLVILEITYTEPGLKGDTSNMPFKNAVLETGATFQVPLFCEIGDKIRIDTREDKYIERIKA